MFAPEKAPPSGEGHSPSNHTHNACDTARRLTFLDHARAYDAASKALVRFQDGTIDVIPRALLAKYPETVRDAVSFHEVPTPFDCRWIPLSEGVPDDGAECLVKRGGCVEPDRWCNGAFSLSEFHRPAQEWMTLSAAIGEGWA